MSRSIRGTRDTQEMIALTSRFLAAQSPSRERTTLVPLDHTHGPLPSGKAVSYSRIIKTASSKNTTPCAVDSAFPQGLKLSQNGSGLK